MTISELGTLPIAALNIGVAAAPSVLAAGAAGIAVDVAGLVPSLAAEVEFTAVEPSPDFLATVAASWAAGLSVEAVLEELDPLKWVAASAGFSAELVLELGLIEVQLAIAESLVGKFRAGLNSGSLAGWTYAGEAPGFGVQLEATTRGGRRDLSADTPIQAIIIATHDFGTWGGLSGTVNTGTSATKDLGARPTGGVLEFQGFLGGAQWNTGLASVILTLEGVLLELQGAKVQLEAQIALSLGLNLPDPQLVIDASLDVDIDAALGSIAVTLDFEAALGTLNAKIEALLKLSADLRASLNISGGGLTAWSYSGPFGSLGSEFAPEIANGLPGVNDRHGACYGLVIACASPSAWADFGLIFKI